MLRQSSVFMRSWAKCLQAQPSNALALRNYSAPKKNMDLIKELREKSGAPIGDIKKCLEASNWDINLAFEALRKKGLATAAKKASRHAAEGLVGFRALGNSVSIVEVNSETDFVARNDKFRALVGQVLDATLKLEAQGSDYAVDVAQLLDSSTEGDVKLSQKCAEVAAVVGENVRIRRAFLVSSPGVVSTYVHQSSAPEMGRIVSVVVLETEGGQKLSEEARVKVSGEGANIAMHAAGMRPQFLNSAAVPASVLEHERALLLAQTEGSGKPANVVAKMVEGRLNKYYEEVCLLNQKYILDDSLTVAKAVAKLGKEVGAPLKLSAFLRVQCGEGLEAAGGKDFAAEVAEMVSGSK